MKLCKKRTEQSTGKIQKNGPKNLSKTVITQTKTTMKMMIAMTLRSRMNLMGSGRMRILKRRKMRILKSKRNAIRNWSSR